MPVTISDDHKSQLNLLKKQDTEVVKEFCRLAGLFLHQEVKPRVFASAANKLDVHPSQVEEAIQALVFLFSQSSRTSLSHVEFKEFATSLGFVSEAAEALTDGYKDNEVQLKEYLTRMGVQVPQYQNLEWRFDILVGSRTLHDIAEPLVTLQLSIDNGSNPDTGEKHHLPTRGNNSTAEKLLLQTDPNNLLHMTTVLEEALQEARTHHSRRIHRHFK